MAGELVRARAAAAGARIIPIDSEHSALWQCLRGEDPASVVPARAHRQRRAVPASARSTRSRRSRRPRRFAHPTWNMGPKVTIDSATMMNKGLEIIEAHFLFDVPYSAIDVAIHPTEHRPQLGRVPRRRGGRADGRPRHARADRAGAGGRRTPARRRAAPRPSRRVAARVPPVDGARFPAVGARARGAGERGGLAPCVLNAANEEAVTAFLGGRCRFDEIVPLVSDALAAFHDGSACSIRSSIGASASGFGAYPSTWAALNAISTRGTSGVNR